MLNALPENLSIEKESIVKALLYFIELGLFRDT